MSEKLVAFLTTCLIVAPICSICVFGPAVTAGFVAGWIGWIANLGLLEAAALGVACAIVIGGFMTWLRARRSGPNSTARHRGNRLEAFR